ncbi:replication factor C large subunit [Candidatus Woesearchaeota archaeon]|nr:replication factor C large subunit [Candidatus Woesearchaeota archaeon]
MAEPWIRKYVPQSSDEIVGHPSVLERVKPLLQRWSRKSKPLWFWGDPGSGKTAAAVALANELNLELVEVNASDRRNKQSIHDHVGGAIKQGSLFGGGKLILIDEVDGLSGTQDRGGIPELLKVLKNSSYPVILTSQDPFDKKFSSLRKACELIQFKTLQYKSIVSRLRQIVKQESIEYEEDSITRIARQAGGDMRAAINDAQSLSTDGRLTTDDVALLDGRDQTESIHQALIRVFKSTKADIARGSFDNVDEDIDQVLLWVDHNLPIEYSNPLDLQRGFDALSMADVFLGRIRRWQHYRFYVYAYDLVTAGVAVAKDDKYKGFAAYKRSDRPLKIWMANQKYRKKKAIAEKIADATHASVNESLRDVPYLKAVFEKNKRQAEVLAEAYDLDEEEVAWLSK